MAWSFVPTWPLDKVPMHCFTIGVHVQLQLMEINNILWPSEAPAQCNAAGRRWLVWPHLTSCGCRQTKSCYLCPTHAVRSLPCSPLRGTLLPVVMTHHQSEQQRPVTVAVTMIYGTHIHNGPVKYNIQMCFSVGSITRPGLPWLLL